MNCHRERAYLPISVTGFQDSDASNNFTPTLPEYSGEFFREKHSKRIPLVPQRPVDGDTEGESIRVLRLLAPVRFTLRVKLIFLPPISVTGFQDSDASDNFTSALPEYSREIFREKHLKTNFIATSASRKQLTLRGESTSAY